MAISRGRPQCAFTHKRPLLAKSGKGIFSLFQLVFCSPVLTPKWHAVASLILESFVWEQNGRVKLGYRQSNP